MEFLGPRAPNFLPVRSVVSRFEDIAHVRIFPLTPMLKKLAECQGKEYPVLHHDSQYPHKVWLRLEENSMRSSLLKFPTAYGPVLTKFQSAITFLTDEQEN